MLLRTSRGSGRRGERTFSPLFYGIRDATATALNKTEQAVKLSVPYFTGFVMLQG